ncbi:MAG TPA: hypothetical protein VEH31_15770 [Streptosporangiaceae bacterium]|nr:hypothetical protein [Streptosporangiaceae bacterium]
MTDISEIRRYADAIIALIKEDQGPATLIGRPGLLWVSPRSVDKSP